MRPLGRFLVAYACSLFKFVSRHGLTWAQVRSGAAWLMARPAGAAGRAGIFSDLNRRDRGVRRACAHTVLVLIRARGLLDQARSEPRYGG
jgi:hypothetical protein